MPIVELARRADGKVSITQAEHDDAVIHVPDPYARVFQEDSRRDFAWRVIRCMDGITVREGRQIVDRLLDRSNGRALGWFADCASLGAIELHVQEGSQHANG